MEWYVYYENPINRTIEKYNIFDHHWFANACACKAEDYKNDKNTFTIEIKHELMYYFWSKCEWEMNLTSWINPDRCNPLKIDVYDQVNLNFSQFINYLWANKEELKRYKLKR